MISMTPLLNKITGALILFTVLGSATLVSMPRLPLEYQAHKVTDRFVQAVNYNQPQDIYPLLTPDLQEIIGPKGFIENFAHERSYPYLTPLFLYVDRIEFSKGNKKGRVICTVAARLPGEKKEYDVVYIPFIGYRMDALKSIVDGSYTWRFDRLEKGKLD